MCTTTRIFHLKCAEQQGGKLQHVYTIDASHIASNCRVEKGHFDFIRKARQKEKDRITLLQSDGQMEIMWCKGTTK